MEKADFYKRLKVAGMLSLVPFVLAFGPWAGFLAGSFLARRFNLPSFLTPLLVIAGFLLALREMLRIIKIAARA